MTDSSPDRVERIQEAAMAATQMYVSPKMVRAILEATHHSELVEALETARDMLLERIHGNPARSSAHNARVIIESALAKIGGAA